MTLNDVIERLGLMPFDEYRNSPGRLAWISEMQARSNEERGHRASGRTTHMLCMAMVELWFLDKDEKIYICAYHSSYARQLVFKAREYAHHLNLDQTRIHVFNRREDDRRMHRLRVFVDHYNPV